MIPIEGSLSLWNIYPIYVLLQVWSVCDNDFVYILDAIEAYGNCVSGSVIYDFCGMPLSTPQTCQQLRIN